MAALTKIAGCDVVDIARCLADGWPARRDKWPKAHKIKATKFGEIRLVTGRGSECWLPTVADLRAFDWEAHAPRKKPAPKAPKKKLKPGKKAKK